MTNEFDQIKQIAAYRGTETQLLKLAEEASEVIQAAIKYRMKPSDATFTALAEELSDFWIIHDQLQYLLPNLIKHEALYRPFKIRREMIRMEEDEKAVSVREPESEPALDMHPDAVAARRYMLNSQGRKVGE